MENKTVKLLLYCTVAKPYLAYNAWGLKGIKYDLYGFKPLPRGEDISLNGTIVAEADCELVEDLSKYEYAYKDNHFYDVLKNACLTTRDLEKYCPVKRGERKSIYGIYLKNVKPFEDPRELSYYGLKKAPQNMCYLYDENGNIIAVVISIQAPHLCNIMNDDKTIEIRKSILNIFKELMDSANSI